MGNSKIADAIEVWAISFEGLLSPMDDDGVECFMAFHCREDAEAALKSQIEKGYIDEGNEWQVRRIA